MSSLRWRPLRRVRLLSLQLALAGLSHSGWMSAQQLEPFASSLDVPVQPAASGRLWLRLRAMHQTDGAEHRRSLGMLELGGDFGLLLARPTQDPALVPTQDTDPSLDLAWPATASPDQIAHRSPLPALPVSADARGLGWQRISTPAPVAPELSAELSRAAVAAALRLHDAATRPGHIDAMATRARASASLPEVRLGAGSSRDESLRFAPTLDDPARFTRDGGRDLWFEARLTWQLDRALFTRDEIALERVKADLEDQRRRLARDVLDALVDWQRARFELSSGFASPSELQAATLQELAAVARLDVMTDGWFSRWLARRPAAALAARVAEH